MTHPPRLPLSRSDATGGWRPGKDTRQGRLRPGAEERTRGIRATLAPAAFSVLSVFSESPPPAEFPIDGQWPDASRFLSGSPGVHFQMRPDLADGSLDFRAACARANYAAPWARGEAPANAASANALSSRSQRAARRR